MKKNGKRSFWRELIQVPTLVSLLTLLVSMILVVFQFAGILRLRTDEMLGMILALLVVISGTLFGKRFGMLREMREKQENLERLISQKKQTKTDTEVLR
jgi:hypothetical protein